MKHLLVILPLLGASSGLALAAPEPADPARRTPWGLYVDSREAFAMKQAQGDKVLLVDVRDPVEIMFTGFAPAVDVVVPFMIANRAKWNEQRSVYQVEKNPRFEADLAKALAARGLSKDTPILLMCRSGGERGAPSAQELWGKGYGKVYVVTDGFEGDTIKEGERKNWRLVDGWKNSGLPWSYRLDKSKFPLGE
ncbi:MULTISPECIES: rhodanese-like domain-containing protein [unclassified Bosea (in: a-proteobacteria)]|uniref:rhodanese-like domain-containing protein n=1 Tax=unclassified Bosea (in: a-proteobacteria) TaxID=2653178 RepID=UPI0009547D8A|nr:MULTISPECIES: rhodanese-like domain-containing protein [unclassified Bosea (in: a-proteobacteria)]TAJ30721.1 MAG: sulfurtransferase [Bosea sp. (in: a-proteobacteria)]SIR27242.1 Rhodanese-like domain-containing protein [Bosea sp. TND4EK4]